MQSHGAFARPNPVVEFQSLRDRFPAPMRRLLPASLRQTLSSLYWVSNDLRDFLAEFVGWLPSHSARLLLLRAMLRMDIGRGASVHRNCRMYHPRSIAIGPHSVVNRDVLLDGRMGLRIGSNVSISEGAAIWSLEHDPSSPTFQERGARVTIEDHVFIGARAVVLPGVTVGRGAVVGAGAVVTRDVEPLAIVAGVPAREIGRRAFQPAYVLNYRKFMG